MFHHVSPTFECEKVICADKRWRRQPFVPKPLPLTCPGSRHKVELVFSPLANMQGLLGYHSSVLIDGEEQHCWLISPNKFLFYPRFSQLWTCSILLLDSLCFLKQEYYFTPSGIRCYPKLSSHKRMSVERIEVGKSVLGGTALLDALSKHFQPRTYDLLRKNCNNFSAAALQSQ
eukprot:s207_g28.t1